MLIPRWHFSLDPPSHSIKKGQCPRNKPAACSKAGCRFASYRSWKVPERTESRHKRRNFSGCYAPYPSFPGLLLKTLLPILPFPLNAKRQPFPYLCSFYSLLRLGIAATAAYWADTWDIRLLEKHHCRFWQLTNLEETFFLFFLPLFFLVMEVLCEKDFFFF